MISHHSKHLPQNISTVKYLTKTEYACLAKVALPSRNINRMGLLERQDL